jgi:hypothetical protein
VMSCTLVGGYQYFGGTLCLHFLPWRWRQQVPPKRQYFSIRVHGIPRIYFSIGWVPPSKSLNVSNVFQATLKIIARCSGLYWVDVKCRWWMVTGRLP